MGPQCQLWCEKNVIAELEILIAGDGRGGGPLTACSPGSRGTRPWHHCQTNFEESIRREASLPGWAMLWMERKTFLRKGMGMMGWITPVEVLPRRSYWPSRQEPIFRDETPRRRCVSGQRACSAAISSKLIGSTAASRVLPTSWDRKGRDKKSATKFFKPGK